MAQIRPQMPPAPAPGQRRPRRPGGRARRRSGALTWAGIAGVVVLLVALGLFWISRSGGSGAAGERVALTGTQGPTATATTATGTGSAAPSTVASPSAAASSPTAARTATKAAATEKPKAGGASGAGQAFGAVHHGSYHLGPVEWNAVSCGPYPSSVQSLEGEYLAGVDLSLNGNGSLCDASALVTTRMGKTILVRIVQTGYSKAPGDMDLSPAAFNAIHQVDPQGTSADPRPMTWRLVKGPANGPIRLQYQTGANPWWASLWVRNPRLPVVKLEVRKAGSSAFTPLTRGGDGTLTDAKGFGSGAFTLRITASDGQVVSQTFSSFTPGSVVTTSMQFR